MAYGTTLKQLAAQPTTTFGHSAYANGVNTQASGTSAQAKGTNSQASGANARDWI